MKKMYSKKLVLAGVIVVAFLSLNYSSGPALNNQSVTGAPFLNGGAYCTNCHNPITNWSPTASIQLLHNGVPVTGNYVGGWNYTLRISRTASASLPAAGGFGFQITCVNAATNANINTWGATPPLTANRVLNSRNYIEHTTKIPKATTLVDIPWTGPASGTGTVRFYLALNTVDGNGNNSNDHPIITNVAFTQAPLPVSWIYFRGREENNNAVLDWAVSNELENDYYTIEKSTDGENFKELSTVKASKGSEFVHYYSFIDNTFLGNAHYRIKQTDINGSTGYHNTIKLNKAHSAKAFHFIEGDRVNVQLLSDRRKTAILQLTDMAGRNVSQEKMILTEGTNKISTKYPLQPGLYILSVQSEGEKIYSAKINLGL